jgi:hypothetical protein
MALKDVYNKAPVAQKKLKSAPGQAGEALESAKKAFDTPGMESLFRNWFQGLARSVLLKRPVGLDMLRNRPPLRGIP